MRRNIYLFFAAILIVGFAACSSNDPSVSVTGVVLNPAALELTVGESTILTATIFPRDADNQNVTWTSSHPAIVSVDDYGVITAGALGTATITVTTTDGGRTRTSAITVAEIPGVGDPTATTDPGIIVNGIRWATRNVDAPGTFAQTPADYGMFYQWNRRIGWSSTDPMVDSNGGTTWDSSLSTGTAWYAANDPCPEGWRVPTEAELSTLTHIDSWQDFWYGTRIRGRFFGTEPFLLFLPVTGVRSAYNEGALELVELWSVYWSSTQHSTNGASALTIIAGEAFMETEWRAEGYSVRCVAR